MPGEWFATNTIVSSTAWRTTPSATAQSPAPARHAPAPVNGGVGSAWTGASNIDRERDADQPRLGAEGSSSTVQRGGGQWSRAHSKKFWSSSSSTVRCCRPTMIQGLSGLCSVSVKPSFDTNVCSHDCQGCGCARADSSVAVAGSTRKVGSVRSAWPSGSLAAALRGGRHRAAHDRAWSAAAGQVSVPSWRAERDE